MRKAELVRALTAVPDFPEPKAPLEQYPTPAEIAADLLWAADEDGDLAGRVVDLGCGTGVLSIGAALLGAKVTGVDVDPLSLEVARAAVPAGLDITFTLSDVKDWQPDGAYSTAIMNPPFGAQNKSADRPFYEAAARAVDGDGACWFLAQPKTESFLNKQAQELGAQLERVITWPYPLTARFGFHDKQVRSISVAGYRMTWG